MASSSDGSRRRGEIRHSHMEQPPLIKMLKNILSEYPDGGQILKELIQNAEDAGARNVKLMFDDRRLNDNTEDGVPEYTKFFKAPALCVYNDAVFTEDDWKGITMIYSSVKENEKMKVGKFGLGFKSVFHITDYPCVLSGDMLLLINPHAQPHKVNSMFDLRDIDYYGEKGLNGADFWRSLSDTFGFDKSAAREGSFPGSLFWFPLREKKSDLSETLYNEPKVNSLFQSIELEAENLLIFMKNLEQISLHRRSDYGCEEILVVEIENAHETVRQERLIFNETVDSMQKNANVNDEDVSCFLPLTISIRSANRHERTDWYVVNYLVSRSASENFKAMIIDTSAGKCPYVGVAVSLQKTINGHVFCFLPLPQEGETLTGLPVHINGFFELNQNRHNLKWDTDEHLGKPIDDRCILWNKALIEEALPMAYEKLVLEAIKRVPYHPNDSDLRCVYNMLPLCQKSTHAQKRWSLLTKELYRKLEKQGIIYSNMSQSWIQFKDVCYATFRDIHSNNKLTDSTKDSLKRCLASLNKMHADIPVELFETLTHHFKFVEDMNALKLASYLKTYSGYKSLADEDKINILCYLLSDQCAAGSLEGLQLLPLENGTWTELRKQGPRVYLCTDDEEVRLFPGLGHKLVLQTTQIKTSLISDLAIVCERGIYQIERMSDSTIKQLLTALLTQFRSYHGQMHLSTSTSPLNIAWLECVWKVLQAKGNIDFFNSVPIIPVLIQGKWECNPVVDLHNPDELFLYNCTDVELGKSFETLMVTLLPSTPNWISISSLQKFAHEATNEGMLSLLLAVSRQRSLDSGICKFNNLPEQTVNSMKQFLIQNPSISKQSSITNFVKRLRMFQTKQTMHETTTMRSISECSIFLHSSDLDMLPKSCALPWRVIVANQGEENILASYGVQKKTMNILVRDIMQSFQYDPTSPTMMEFMDFFINHFALFAHDTNIINLAKNISFLKVGSKLHTPSQLFDPSDKELKELLLGQDLFPKREQGLSDQYLYVLRRLDLKSADRLDGNTMLQVATECNRLSALPPKNEMLKKKSQQMMKLLCENPSFLSQRCSNGQTLQQNLVNLNWVPVAKRPHDYPSTIPWFSDGKIVSKPSAVASMTMALLVGSKTDIATVESDKICEAFNWRNMSSLDTVVAHLETLQAYYELRLKPEILHMVKRIYEYISCQPQNQLLGLKSKVAGKKIIWTGKGFEIPDKVVIDPSNDDIDLEPYFYALPDELFDFKKTFSILGCQQIQNNHLLSQTLHEIKRNCNTQLFPNDSPQSAIKQLILNVLAKLSKQIKINSDGFKQLELLMLVENDTDEIQLYPISSCIMDDNDDDNTETESDLRFVHEDVPRQVAIDLGITSAKSKTLAEAINKFQPWGQTEPLTKRIETLLKREYTFGLGVPKELIQNADDAGAKSVTFVFDERENNDARDRLLSSAMSECQGNALWVYNDETFSKDDLENIRLLNGGTKAEDVETIGKFGLGFCSVYNLTEMPCFISGDNLVIFDPQEKYIRDLCETSSPGLKVSLCGRRQRRLIRDHIDQFKPFQNVLGCTPTDPEFKGFNGTLFRFPLRTTNQALASKLCQTPCLRENILQLLESVVDNAGNLLLFTQHVTKLEIFHIPKEETDPSNAALIFEIDKSTIDTRGYINQDAQCVLSRLHASAKQTLSEVHRLTIEQKYFSSHKVSLAHSSYECKSSWIVSWISERHGTSTSAERGSKHIPISAIALPVDEDVNHYTNPLNLQDINNGFPSYGLLFCFLPLPIQTKMPFHINGYFEVSSDRKRLVQSTEDEFNLSNSHNWNRSVFQGSTVSSFIQLLEYIAGICNDDYNYHTLWPVKRCDVVNDFRRQFFTSIYSIPTKLFRSSHGWHKSDDVVILHPDITKTDVKEAAFNMLDHFPIRAGKQVIDMPEEVYNAIRECVPDLTKFEKSIVSEVDLINRFLDVISEPYWNDKISNRNSLILYALNMTDETILNRLNLTACVPSLPNGSLRRPRDLIDPSSEIAKMFQVTDGYFPEKEFAQEHMRNILHSLGMMFDILPQELFINRCHSVSLFGKMCCSCSREQCANVTKYIYNHIVNGDMKDDKELIESLKNIPILPVLEHPSDWSFTWAADNIVTPKIISCNKHSDKTPAPFKLAKPVELHEANLRHCIGSLKLIVDESFLKALFYFSFGRILQILGVNNCATPEMLKDQLSYFAAEYIDSKYVCLLSSYRNIYSKLQAFIDEPEHQATNEQTIRELFSSLQHKRIVLVGKELVPPTCVAINVQHEYLPHLCRLPDSQIDKKKLFSLIGVSENFSSESIIEVLKVIQNGWSENQCIDVVVNLLKNLCNSMEKEDRSYSDLKDVSDFIVAPDIMGQLHSTYALVIEDSCFNSTRKMNFLHGHVPPDIGQMLGVKSKRKRAVETFAKLIPFGQKEDLATRLRGLLEDYPCDASIMKELLQNADDAEATELHFIKDFRKSTSSANSESFGLDAMQPPALCVFNDGYFTEADFEGIQNLGKGSKESDPTKTGQYGVGFNTVYHITDSPSFFTKGPGLGPRGTLCIFDPLMKVIADYVSPEERGIRCDAAEMAEDFPDILDYYMADKLFSREKGTLFRLPLRTVKSDISDGVMTEKNIDQYLEEMKKDLFEMLLFVKNVRKIKVCRIDENNEIIEEYCVESTLTETDEEKRRSFFSTVWKDTPSSQQMTVDYQMKIVDNLQREASWCIVHCFGLSNAEETNSTLNDARDNGICQLPLGAVAIPVIDKKLREHAKEEQLDHAKAEQEKNETSIPNNVFQKETDTLEKISGKAFCFLPLKGNTSLRFHYNGHFVLDRARTGIYMDGVKGRWNKLVMQETVAKAWIHGMIIIKGEIDINVKLSKTWRNVNHIMRLYETFFPLNRKDYEGFNQTLAGYIYHTISKEGSGLFPVVMRKKEATRRVEYANKAGVTTNFRHGDHFSLLWTGLANNENQFGGVFNYTRKSFSSMKLKGQKDESHLLGNLLKSIGLKLIEISLYENIDSFNVPVLRTDKNSVAKFIATYESELEGRCHFGETNVSVENTLFENRSQVISLISYIVQDNRSVSQKIARTPSPFYLLKDLPLCITSDGILRRFDSENPVYWSSYAHLLPRSSSCFLDNYLHQVLDIGKPDLLAAGLIKEFTVTDMQKLLPTSYSQKLLANSANVRWSKEEGNPLSVEFLRGFYTFIEENSKTTTEYSTFTDSNKLKQNIGKLQEWAFIPSVETSNANQKFELVPIANGDKVLYIDTNDTLNEQYASILNKLNVPLLDISVFVKMEKYIEFGICGVQMERRRKVKLSSLKAIQSIVATLSDPCSFSRFLVHYKERINCSTLSIEDANTLLKYFHTRISQLLDQKTIYLLRDLALFQTLEGDLKALNGYSEVVLVPSDVPDEGLSVWSNKTNTLLLRENVDVKKVYESLKLTSISVVTFYTEHILKHMNKLPLESIVVHMKYIRDVVLQRLENDTDIDRVINIISEVKFIEVNGIYHKAKELFLRSNIVFKVMIDESLFLPETFLEDKWTNFLKKLDLNVDVSQTQLIQFATAIEADGVYRISEKTALQSKTLLDFFMTKKIWNVETFNEIKNIKFFLPRKVSEKYNSICQQIDGGERFICFNGSLPYYYKRICWTSSHILQYPYYRGQIDPQAYKLLGILSSPTLSAVISHCQNVCEKIHTSLQKQINKDAKQIRAIFQEMYEFMSRHVNDIGENEKQRLQNTKCVLISDNSSSGIMLVKAEDIVVELRPEYEIKPYLWRIPECLSRYRDVFLRLGSARNVSFSHYVAVLKKIKKEFPEDVPPANMEKVSKCLKGLVKHLESDQESIALEPTSILYLPNRREKLIKSTKLTVCDNEELEKRLGGNTQCDFFIGFQKLDIHVSDTVAPFKRLPSHLRPKILSEQVEEVVCLDSLETRHCRFALRLEAFLRCPYLIEGVVRLVKHQLKKENSDLTRDDELGITRALVNVSVERVSGLQTNIRLNDTVVASSEQEKTCFIQQCEQDGIQTFKLYFQVNGETANSDELLMSSLVDEDDGLQDLLDKCAKGLMKKDTYKHLSSILKDMKDPNKISTILDKKNIAAYNLPNALRSTVFPPPGTYIPDFFFPFLERSISFFKEHEFRYVAYDIGDFNSSLDDYNEVYIYAHIVRRVNPECTDVVAAQYEIDIGAESTAVVSIYRLFKFVPQTNEETGTDLVVYDSEPVGAVAFDENCRRIRQMLIDAWCLSEEDKRRVINRLKLKWHPDRNSTNKEYANKVYNYLTNIILELERTGTVGTQPCFTTSDMSNSAYGSMSQNVHSTGCAYAQAWRDNVDNYRRSYNGGQFSHSSARSVKCRDVHTAKRWNRQAVNDFQMAKSSMTLAGTVHGYNWICYKCHQACEKALKAAGFAEDANSVMHKSHSLSALVGQLSDGNLAQLVQTLETTLGPYFALRYPDACDRQQIPSDVYTENHAKTALDVTKQILDIVSELLE